MQTSIWPSDVLSKPVPPDRSSLNHLRCFLICPFTPKERYDDLLRLVKGVCDLVGQKIGCQVECIRADKITSAGVIHSEIWTHIGQADVVVADVSGLNGNVMLELGVASVAKQKEHVVIIREENPEERFLFDIGPARHILYSRTATGYAKLTSELSQSVLMALSNAPAYDALSTPSGLPLNADYSAGADVDWLVSPPGAHRRIKDNALEFGSFFVFRNSWLSIANLSLDNFELTAEMRFSEYRSPEGWIGISLRNQSYFANYGHLFYLTADGRVMRTEPKDDRGNYEDILVGNISGFVLDDTPHRFYARVTDGEFVFEIDDVSTTVPVPDMPFVFSSGRVLFQTHRLRGAILNASVSRV